MIERLKEIRSKFKPENDADIHADSLRALDELLGELEAKEAGNSAYFGYVTFALKDEAGSTTHDDFRELDNVIIHEGDICNGKKWFAISGILIEKE